MIAMAEQLLRLSAAAVAVRKVLMWKHVCLVVLVSSSAFADPMPEPRVRQGLELGGGLQGGHMACESQNGKCDGFAAAGGGNLQASWFTNPKLGLTADAWVMAHTESNLTFSHYINTLGVKWRPVPALTLQGGVGVAHAAFSYSGIMLGTSRNAFAVMAGASYDVVRGRRWALSIDARFGDAFYGDANHDGVADVKASNVGVGAGLTFFNF
jgi:hypothetical protein